MGHRTRAADAPHIACKAEQSIGLTAGTGCIYLLRICLHKNLQGGYFLRELLLAAAAVVVYRYDYERKACVYHTYMYSERTKRVQEVSEEVESLSALSGAIHRVRHIR